MEQIPNVKKEDKSKHPSPLYQKGQVVYINAFLKSEKGKFFVCKCLIEEIPQPNQRRVYKVKIVAVADKALGVKVSTPAQASLLGRVITKRENEMVKEIAPFMLPKAWITVNPNAKEDILP